MNKNKLFKVTIKCILIILILVFCININKSFAISDVTKEPDLWNPVSTDTNSNVSNKVKPILGIISFVGTTISVCSLAVIGLKIMFGSIDEKANYKQTLIPWAIGAFMVFSMTTIPNIVYNLTADKPAGTVAIGEAEDGGYGKRVDYCICGDMLQISVCLNSNCSLARKSPVILKGGFVCSKCNSEFVEMQGRNYCTKCEYFRTIKNDAPISIGDSQKYAVCKYGWAMEKDGEEYVCIRKKHYKCSCNNEPYRYKDENEDKEKDLCCSACHKKLNRNGNTSGYHCSNCKRNYVYK